MMNAGVKMNILKILMNTKFTPFAEVDYETNDDPDLPFLWELLYANASDHAKIGEYKDMFVVIDGGALDPSSIEVFDESGDCIYSGYVTKDGRGVREVDVGGLRS